MKGVGMQQMSHHFYRVVNSKLVKKVTCPNLSKTAGLQTQTTRLATVKPWQGKATGQKFQNPIFWSHSKTVCKRNLSFGCALLWTVFLLGVSFWKINWRTMAMFVGPERKMMAPSIAKNWAFMSKWWRILAKPKKKLSLSNHHAMPKNWAAAHPSRSWKIWWPAARANSWLASFPLKKTNAYCLLVVWKLCHPFQSEKTCFQCGYSLLCKSPAVFPKKRPPYSNNKAVDFFGGKLVYWNLQESVGSQPRIHNTGKVC